MTEVADDLNARIERISVADFIADHAGLLDAVFGAPLQDGPAHQPFESPLFANDGWRAMLLPGQIGALDHSGRLDEPDSVQSPRLFWRPIDWLTVILSVHWSRPSPHVFQAWTAVLAGSPRLDPETHHVCRVPATAELVRSADAPPDGPFWSEVVFDPLGEWGMIDIADEPVTMLGATTEMFERFLCAFGGASEVRECFRSYLDCQARRNNPDSPGESGLNERYLASFRPIYERIGWPWPFADHIGRDLIGD
jgi:hypothetical protein